MRFRHQRRTPIDTARVDTPRIETAADVEPGKPGRSPHLAPLALAALMAAVAFGVVACAGDPPEVPDGDPGLVLGRQIYKDRCATCHGASGEGGTGNRLNNGRVIAAHPDADSQIELIRNGRGRMPSFSSFSDEELDAVVRYTREIINEQ